MDCYATTKRLAWASLVLTAMAGPLPAVAADDRPTAVEIKGGTAAFDAATNISAIAIHGKSVSLEGRGTVRPTDNGLILEALTASLPVKTISTGMRLRDEHMRRYVFTTPDGQVPDLRFSASQATCVGSNTQSSCELSGELNVRGVTRPFTLTLKVMRDASGYRAVGDGLVKLSTYGIQAPSQLGVRTEDVVKVHVDFAARPATLTNSTRGAE